MSYLLISQCMDKTFLMIQMPRTLQRQQLTVNRLIKS